MYNIYRGSSLRLAEMTGPVANPSGTAPVLQPPGPPPCEWATFPVVLLQASPPGQSPSLPKFNFSAALPTSVSTAVYCKIIRRFAAAILGICTLGFEMHFKLVDFLGIRSE
jgi:hypothetical protein